MESPRSGWPGPGNTCRDENGEGFISGLTSHLRGEGSDADPAAEQGEDS